MGFLQVNDKYLSRGLKPLEFCILSKVEEFTSKGKYCYITNSSLAELFGVSERTIKAYIKKLIEKGLLKKTNTKINEKGKQRRILTIPEMQNPSPIGEETAPNPIGSIKKRAKQNAPKIPTQEEFKEFFKGQGQEKLANGFYEYCTNEKGWENITNWRAYAKKYIKEPYDLTKTKKPKATKKNHKSNEIPTQEEREALRREIEKMVNDPIAPLKRT